VDPKEFIEHLIVEQKMSPLEAIEAFMRQAKQPMGVGFTMRHSDPTRVLRRKLLHEELKEYIDAERDNDLVEVVDGLIDIIWIAWGTLLTYVGPDVAQNCADEVSRTNLAKVFGPGLPEFRSDGKVVKPAGWVAPDMTQFLKGVPGL